MSDKLTARACVFYITLGLAVLYADIAFIVFQWRNPTANDAACWRELPAVLRLERLERYQPKP